MRLLPTGRDIPRALVRVLVWTLPLPFIGPNPYHGYRWDFLAVLGIWWLCALIGAIRNPRWDAKVFYAVWLVATIGLAWWTHQVQQNSDQQAILSQDHSPHGRVQSSLIRPAYTQGEKALLP